MGSNAMIANDMAETLSKLNAFELAYKELQEIQKRLKVIEDGTKAIYEYAPFGFASDVQYKLRNARIDLIKWCAETLRAVVTPMASLDKHDFGKMMNDCVGNEEDFSAKCLTSFFQTLNENHEAVKLLSLETIHKRVRKFLPYSNANGGWSAVTKVDELLESGTALVLRCFTWRGNTLSWSMNDEHQFNALHKAIEIALFDMDPATVEKYTQMTDHVTKKRTPEEFYQTIVTQHPAISRFRFFKNITFKVWFKNRDQALRVATFLVESVKEGSA